MAAHHHIDIRTEPVDGPVDLDADDTPILAPTIHPDYSHAWVLYYPTASGEVESFSFPDLSRGDDPVTPEKTARNHLVQFTEWPEEWRSLCRDHAS